MPRSKTTKFKTSTSQVPAEKPVDLSPSVPLGSQLPEDTDGWDPKSRIVTERTQGQTPRKSRKRTQQDSLSQDISLSEMLLRAELNDVSARLRAATQQVSILATELAHARASVQTFGQELQDVDLESQALESREPSLFDFLVLD